MNIKNPGPPKTGIGWTVNNNDLAHLIGQVAGDVAAVRATQAEQESDIKELKDASARRDEIVREADSKRAAFWWKFVSLTVALLLVPTITVIWQAGRLIERIDNIAQQVTHLNVDHEVRLRSLEHH